MYDYIYKINENKFLAKKNNDYYELTNVSICNLIKNINGLDYEQKIFRLNNKVVNYIKLYKINDLELFKEININSEQLIIIEFFDIIIAISHKKYIETVIRRHFESIEYILAYNINQDKPRIYYRSSFSINIINQLINNIYNSGDNIYYYDKATKSFIKSYFKDITLREKPLKNTSMILNNKHYIIETTRYIIKNDINLENYVGRFGPVHNLNYISNIDRLDIPIFQCESSRSLEELEYSVHGGKGFNINQSKFSAIGESIERYSSRMFGSEEKILEKYSVMKEKYKTLNPELLYLDKDYVNTYNEEKIYEWTTALNLVNEQEYYIPCNTVYFPYNVDNDYMLHSQSTTGISSGVSYEDAILQGVLEVIERDAYSITHKAKIDTKEIIIDQVTSNKSGELLRIIKGMNIDIHLKLINIDYNCYVVHCVLEDKSFPIYSHGSGASLDIETAINRSILEAVQMRTSQLLLKKSEVYDSNNIYIKWGEGDKKYCEIFLNDYNNEKIKVSSLKSFASNNLKEDIDKIVKALNNEGYNVFCANLSRKDTPLKTVRIVIPGFQDIDNYNTRDTLRLKNKLKGRKKNTLPLFS